MRSKLFKYFSTEGNERRGCSWKITLLWLFVEFFEKLYQSYNINRITCHYICMPNINGKRASSTRTRLLIRTFIGEKLILNLSEISNIKIRHVRNVLSMPLSRRNWNVAGNHGRFSAASESETAVKLYAITTSVIRDNRARIGYVQYPR